MPSAPLSSSPNVSPPVHLMFKPPSINLKVYKQQILQIEKKFTKEHEETLTYFKYDDFDREDEGSFSSPLPTGYA